jgi:hypothetical protein
VNSNFTAVTVVTAGQASPYSGPLPTSIVKPEPHNFSPRLGIAWRPSQKRGMIIRTGYSIFYSGSVFAQVASQMAAQPQFATTATYTNNTAAPFSIQNGLCQNLVQGVCEPPQSTSITNTYAIDPNFRMAYAQTWNFSIQNNLPGGMVLDTEYNGTKGTHLGVVENPNRAVGTGANAPLQIPYATNFTYQTARTPSTTRLRRG